MLQPAVARTLLDVAIFFGPVLTGATTTMIGPVTLAAFQGHGIPKWLGVIGIFAFVEQATETITIFGNAGFTEPGGAMNMQLGAALTLIWLIAFGAWGAMSAQPSGVDEPLLAVR